MNYFSDFFALWSRAACCCPAFFAFFIEGDIMLLTKWDNSGIIKP